MSRYPPHQPKAGCHLVLWETQALQDIRVPLVVLAAEAQAPLEVLGAQHLPGAPFLAVPMDPTGLIVTLLILHPEQIRRQMAPTMRVGRKDS